MSELTTIARPYAKAAFELAADKGTVEALMISCSSPSSDQR